jgi:ATP-dependent RNA helicase DDX19/DBP5
MTDPDLPLALIRLHTNEKVQLWCGDKKSELFPECPWEELIQNENLLQAIYRMEFDFPSKVQCQAIPVLTAQRPQSLIAQAPSGCGKTVAFLCSLFLRVDPHIKELQGICLAPTTELSHQSYDIVARPMNEHLSLTLGYAANREYKVTGGGNKPQILIGTPAGVIRAIRDHKLDVSYVQLLILDEADKLLHPSNIDRRGGDFISDIKRLLRPDQPHEPRVGRPPVQAILPPTVTVGFFSASFTDRSVKQCKTFRPGLVELRRKEVPCVISHLYRVIPDGDDPDLEAQSLINQYYSDVIDTGQAIVFLSRKESVDTFVRLLNERKFTCCGTHGSVPVEQRMQTIADFRREKFKILVGTNLLARGIDIPQVHLVIQIGVSREDAATRCERGEMGPQHDDRAKTIKANFIDYQHRAGRAGRFGRPGISFSIIQERERPIMEEIAKMFQITVREVPRGASICKSPLEQYLSDLTPSQVKPVQSKTVPQQMKLAAVNAVGEPPRGAAGQPKVDQPPAGQATK